MPEIKYVVGDATQPPVEGIDDSVILHCCNDIGAWGAGFVIPLGKRYPKARDSYLNWYNLVKEKGEHRLPLGHVQVVEVDERIRVANLIGQEGVGGAPDNPPIRYEAIESGLRNLSRWAGFFEQRLAPDQRHGQTVSFHMPRMGCGLAGGSWAKVEELILQNLSRRFQVTVYDFPGGHFNP